MDIESTLVAKALSTGDLSLVVTRGIEADHFYDDDVRDVYEYSIDFLMRHKQPPSMVVIKEEFPGWKPKLSKDPLSWHMERFINHVKENKAVELVRAYHDMLEDPDAIPEIEVHALEMARELTEVVPAPRVEMFSEGRKRIAEAERRKREGIMHGIMYGIPTFDEITLGIQPHELVVAAGYMGAGKTTLMQHIAMSAYLQGKKILFISLEVEAEQILRKFDVMNTDIRYRALKALELDVGEQKRWEEMLERAESEKHEHDILIRDDIKNCTVEKVLAETVRWKPDIVCVDYLELMKVPRGLSNSHWEAVSHSGTGLKQNARIMKIPHVTAAQLNRDGGKGEVTLATLGYQSIGKHADTLIGLNQDDEMREREEMKLVLLKYRDGPTSKPVVMNWNLDKMDIKEKGVESRFVTRQNYSLSSRERKKEQRLEVATRMRGKENPIMAGLRAKQRGQKPKLKTRARS